MVDFFELEQKCKKFQRKRVVKLIIATIVGVGGGAIIGLYLTDKKTEKRELKQVVKKESFKKEHKVVSKKIEKVVVKEKNETKKELKQVTKKELKNEIKKEINTDYELKKSYFQAVSNSSWANYGYLVALEISDNLKDEMERLNQSFGIGIIELKSNPYES